MRYFPPIPEGDQLGLNNPNINSITPKNPNILLPKLLKTFGEISCSKSYTLYLIDLYLITKRVQIKNKYTTIFGPNKRGDTYSFKSITLKLSKARRTKLAIINNIGIIAKNLKINNFFPSNDSGSLNKNIT